jgi:isopenicillin N synthase-like dioxygenase
MKAESKEYTLITEEGMFWNKYYNTSNNILTNNLKDATRWTDHETPRKFANSLSGLKNDKNTYTKEIGEIAARVRVVAIKITLEICEEG